MSDATVQEQPVIDPQEIAGLLSTLRAYREELDRSKEEQSALLDELRRAREDALNYRLRDASDGNVRPVMPDTPSGVAMTLYDTPLADRTQYPKRVYEPIMIGMVIYHVTDDGKIEKYQFNNGEILVHNEHEESVVRSSAAGRNFDRYVDNMAGRQRCQCGFTTFSSDAMFDHIPKHRNGSGLPKQAGRF